MNQNSEYKNSKKRHLIVGFILICILLSGATLRFFYLREIVNNPDFSYPFLDGAYHDYWAKGLATGDWNLREQFTDPQINKTPFFRPPGYPYFLAFIYYFSDCSYMAPRIVQMGLGLLNCILIYLLAKKIFGYAEALLSAAFMSVYWVFIYYEGELLAPVLLVGLGLLLIRIICSWCDKFTFWRALIGGVILGLFALVRPNILLFIPAVIAWSWWVGNQRKEGKRIGMTWLGFVSGAVITIIPVTIRNYIVADDFVLITSNAGINLYIGNNEKATGFIMSEVAGIDRWKSSDYPKIVSIVEAEQGRKMKHSEVSSYFTNKAIDYIRKHPVRTMKLIATKALLFWGPVEVGNNKEIHCEKLNSSVLRYIPGFPAVLTLALFGLIPLFMNKAKHLQMENTVSILTTKQLQMVALLLLFIIVFFISLLPFFAAERFRVPIIPFLIIFGAYGLCNTAKLIRTRGLFSVTWLAIGYVVVYVIVSHPFITQRSLLDRWHYNRADIYRLTKQYNLAVDEYLKVYKINPQFPQLNTALGKTFLKQGKTDKALEYYAKELLINTESPENHYNYAGVLTKGGRTDEAIGHYNKALELARSKGQNDLAGIIQKRLDLYKQAKPYQDPDPKPKEAR